MRNLVLKIGLRGDIYINFKAATGEQMTEAVTSLNAEGGIVTYYRESPETKASDKSMEVFQRLVALRPKIRLGNTAASEWGKLEWFEVEEAPHLWRIFVARGQQFLLSLPVPQGQNVEVFIGGPLPADAEDAWLGRLDFIIRSDRVLETPLHRPDLAFKEPAQTDSSLHIRISYGATRRWVSCYDPSEIPGNLASFQADIVRVARQIVSRARGS